MTAIGAERKHATFSTNFCSPRETVIRATAIRRQGLPPSRPSTRVTARSVQG